DDLALVDVYDLHYDPDVLLDYDRLVDGREVGVVLRDRTHTTVDDAQRDLVADVDLEQRVLEGLHGTRDVTLEDEVERLDLALLERLGEVLEADALAALGQEGCPLGGLALLGDLPRGAVVGGDEEAVARARHRGQTQHEDRAGRARLGDLVA